MTSGTISSMENTGGRNTKKGKHTSMIFLLSNTNLVIHLINIDKAQVPVPPPGSSPVDPQHSDLSERLSVSLMPAFSRHALINQACYNKLMSIKLVGYFCCLSQIFVNKRCAYSWSYRAKFKDH